MKLNAYLQMDGQVCKNVIISQKSQAKIETLRCKNSIQVHLPGAGERALSDPKEIVNWYHML